MFEHLRTKWNVSPRQFWIIFIAFGCTGLTTAYLTKILASWLGMDEETWWVYRAAVKVFMLVFGYQVLLLFYGALFGQWKFFWSFEKRLLQRLRIMNPNQQPDQLIRTRIAIFASGAGSNAEKIIAHFENHPQIEVKLVVCNKPAAGVLNIAKANNIDTLLIEKERFLSGDGYIAELVDKKIDFIVLAGFLWKIPDLLISHYPNKIINIHPALLPKFGGKGMYGSRVHEAVINAGETDSGITIHYVDGHYDNGDIIFQAACAVDEKDTPDSLASKIHQLEHQHFSHVIEEVILRNNR